MSIARTEVQGISNIPKDSGTLEEKITAQIVKAVDSAEAPQEPYCHYYIEKVFPPDVYAQIIDKLPAPSFYAPLNLKEWSRPDGESTRDRL